MSTLKSLRKRTSFNYSNSSNTITEKVNTELGLLECEAEEMRPRQSAVSSNGKVFFSCQYCNEIFSQKLACTNHMTKCPKKTETHSVLNDNQSKLNNNDIDTTDPCTDEDLSNCSSSDEYKPTEEKKNSDSINKNDVSIYDYDEEDDDLEDRDLKENSEENINNRKCKHCKTLFDNPLDLLRHTRDCHNFPRKILPPDEIEKYFDYPNRQFCPICEKPIKTRNFRSVFIKHLLVHTTGLTHECSICKRKFRRRDHMRAHEKRHVVAV